jgi:DeoR family suf operon transcriptional repressor
MMPLQQASTKYDILRLLMKEGEATAQLLARVLGISPQATRRHLKDLEAEGLIALEVVRGGMGRPQHRYRLSTAGRSQFPDSYDDFALELLDTLVEQVGQEGVSSILRAQWVRRGLEYRQRIGDGPVQERVARLVELRRAEGYMAEWAAIAPEAAESERPGVEHIMLTEHNCAISTVAESFPKVCDHELEMLAIALSDCTVERTHWIVEGEHRCGYVICEMEDPEGDGEGI